MTEQPRKTKHQAAIDSALGKATKRRWPEEADSVLTTGKKATKEFYDIPSKWIEIDARQVRQSGKDLKGESLTELAKDIEENGLMHPVVVEEISKDRYRVLFGERRFLAMSKLLKWEAILCRITTIDEQKRRFSQLSENLHREDLAAFDLADAIAELMREHDLPLAQMAAKLHKSQPWVQRALTVTKKLTPAARELLAESDAASSLAAIYYVATVPAGEQKEIAKAVATGRLSQREIIALTSEAKKAKGKASGRGRRTKPPANEFEKRITIEDGTVTLRLGRSEVSKKRQIAAIEEALLILAKQK